MQLKSEDDYNQKINDLDILSCNLNEDSKVLYYGNTDQIPNSDCQNKRYFKLLYSLDIDIRVKNLVEHKIVSIDRRFHFMSDDVLCSYIISSYQELNIDFSINSIFKLFNIDPNKSNVLVNLSKITSKDTHFSGDKNTISMMLIKPSSLVEEIFNIYVEKHNQKIENRQDICQKIIEFAQSIEDLFPDIIQYSANDMASAFIYIFLEIKCCKLKRTVFNKKIFSTLTDTMIKKRFEVSYDLINKKLKICAESHVDFINKFLCT